MKREKILIVDDDKDLLLGLSIRLKSNDFDVVFASDAVSAISVARKEKPDVILLDLGLPGGDGYTVLNRLRSLGELMITPVIVLSAREPSSEESKSLVAGAAAYFQKPVDNYALISTINQLTRVGAT